MQNKCYVQLFCLSIFFLFIWTSTISCLAFVFIFQCFPAFCPFVVFDDFFVYLAFSDFYLSFLLPCLLYWVLFVCLFSLNTFFCLSLCDFWLIFSPLMCFVCVEGRSLESQSPLSRNVSFSLKQRSDPSEITFLSNSPLDILFTFALSFEHKCTCYYPEIVRNYFVSLM
jgi:hypothetical protein